jgi:ribosomal protein S18 acetylase RimI-like enzyme
MPEIFTIPDVVVTEAWLSAILEDTNRELVVIEHRRELVGAILFKSATSPDDIIFKARDFGYIEELVVKESFKGKGLGTRLLDHAVEALRARGIKEIELNVWENNNSGTGFFENYGFKTIQRRMELKIQAVDING